MGVIFAIVLSILAIFLILLVLVQRGRGGGLAGALGGMGGSSAFGAKAGDVFTRITIVTAAIWIVVCLMAAYWARHRGDSLSGGGAVLQPPGTSAPRFPASGGEATAGGEAPAAPATGEAPAEPTGGSEDQ